MPSLTVRLSPDDIATLKQRATIEGVALSVLARRLLLGPEQLSEMAERVEAHERRLQRLEEMAGL